jgi:hypothetical protein
MKSFTFPGPTSWLIVFVLAFSIISCNNNKTVTLEAGSLSLSFDKSGNLTAIKGLKGNDYLPKGEKAPLLTLRVKGKYEKPTSLVKKEDTLILTYPSAITALVVVKQNPTWFSFELIKLEKDAGNVELAVWGPYPTTISKTIGETVGVVRDDEFAVGIQSLNLKTLGGYPWSENDCMPQIDIFDQDDFNELSEEGKRYVLYRVEAAKPTKTGSSLQAYCRNRDKERIIENLGFRKYVAPVWNDGGVIGSKIALFGCPVNEVLPTIGRIELAEELPHTMINGQWAKTSSRSSAAYMIMSFGENDIEKALAITKRAGLKNLYHPGPFETWGHFKLNSRFPNGISGLKTCVDKAKAQGITLGFHTLSNFISTNDAYVTPVPDKRLAKVGSSEVVDNITASQTEIEVASPGFFKEFKNSHLKTVMIGNELIRFGGVSDKAPWKLLDCQRGAFDTKAGLHQKGETISLLADHGYKVFLTSAELTQEISKNIARIFNETGMCQISFDGLEGNRSTALGSYGESMMPYTWYSNLSEKIKQNTIVHASRTTHFFWHIYTRMNWGEPWYAGFRESQTDYRIKNQAYFKRNYMPAMLGWFSLKKGMSLDDMEWMLARSAAFDAGYAFSASYKALEEYGQSDQLLNLIKIWEEARLNGAFTEELKKEMEDLNNEYHLEAAGKNKWNLYRLATTLFSYANKEKQPGEPKFSSFSFTNPYQKQPLVITIKPVGGSQCKNISVEMDNYKKVVFPVELKSGQILSYDGEGEIDVYDDNRNLIKSVQIENSTMIIDNGVHGFNVEAVFTGGEKPEIQIGLKTLSDKTELMSQ